MIVVPVLAVGAVATVTGVVLGSDGAAGKLRPVLTRPQAYQVVYRVTSLTTGTRVSTWEVLTVHRPFASSDITYATDPAVARGAPRSATWFDVDGLYTLDGTDTVRRVAGRQPGPSGSDQALGVELDALGSRGLARDTGETQRLAGRPCRVVRFREPPVGAIRPLDGGDHDDLCIDAAGLILSERWVLHRRTVLTRTAVRVRTGEVRDPMTPDGAKPLPGHTAIPTVTPGVDPAAPVRTPPTPHGYQLARADVFTLPAPSGGGLAARSTVWAFTRGPDAITVEAGVERGGGYPWDNQPTATTRVDLPGLGPATTALRSDGPEVRVALGTGQWVRIHGTVPLERLVGYARRLTAAR